MNAKQKRRRYRVHYNLRKKQNTVITKERMVIKRDRQLSAAECKWLNELIDFGYCVCDNLFS